ncbi:conserved transmembrane domain protein [Mycobacterium xenopi 3993]|nr:conserved transmembrane domain protein [Mycobacterium xenopi 3993]
MVGAGVRPDAGAAGGGAAAGPGYLLLRDAVSTPRSYLSDTALGLGESAPRASPQDFAVALASHVLDGGVVVKVLLVAGLWLAGWGAARLVARVLPDAGRPASSSRPRWRSGTPMSPSGYCRGIGVCWSATAACPGLRRAWWICASV